MEPIARERDTSAAAPLASLASCGVLQEKQLTVVIGKRPRHGEITGRWSRYRGPHLSFTAVEKARLIRGRRAIPGRWQARSRGRKTSISTGKNTPICCRRRVIVHVLPVLGRKRVRCSRPEPCRRRGHVYRPLHSSSSILPSPQYLKPSTELNVTACGLTTPRAASPSVRPSHGHDTYGT